MQIIRSFLKIGSAGAVLCDAYGSETGVALELMLGTGCQLEFELHRDSTGSSAQLPDYPVEELQAAAFYFALDSGQNNSDDPLLLIFSNVTLTRESSGKAVLTVPVDPGVSGRIAEAMKSRNSAEFFAELGGFDGEGKCVFAWQFKLLIRSRVYLGNGNESLSSDPEYYTAVQVQAIAAALEEKIVAAGKNTAETILIADEGNCFAGDNVEAALQETASRLGSSESSLQQVESRLSAVETASLETDGKFESVESRLSAVETASSGVDSKFDSIESRLSAVETASSGVDSKFDSIESRLSAVETASSDVDGKFNSVDSSLQSLTAQVNSLQSSLQNVESQLDGLETVLEGI